MQLIHKQNDCIDFYLATFRCLTYFGDTFSQVFVFKRAKTSTFRTVCQSEISAKDVRN